MAKKEQKKNQKKINLKEMNKQGIPPLLNWVLIILVAYLAFQFFMPDQNTGNQIPYSQFKSEVRSGNVESVTITGDQVAGIYTGESPEKERRFYTVIPPYTDENLSTILESNNVKVTAKSTQKDIWDTLLVSVLPFLILIGFFIWMGYRARQQSGGFMSIGKSKAKMFSKEESRTSFEDVAGYKEQKEELQETIRFLKDPEEFEKLSAKVPKGILLIGPPGTGKTLVARAVAGEADVPFYHLSGSDFMEMLVGVGASRVRDLFDKAKKNSPAIIFLDELDSIGQRRGGVSMGGGHNEREQTLNQLLSEMDGFEPTEGVIVMAATNRPDVLDQALLRPGRFDRRIRMSLPNMRERHQILKVHTADVPLDEDLDLEDFAKSTPGQSGADLENLVNEAAITAVKQEAKKVSYRHFQIARDKIMMGRKRSSLILSDDEKERIAYHEGGHAIVASFQDETDPVEKVTIIPRGRSLGSTQQLPDDERHNYSQTYLEQKIAVMMGGRAAEKLVFDEITTGAENDLVQATKLARKMVSNWGMSERVGTLAFRQDDQTTPQEKMLQGDQYSQHLAELIDEETQAILDRCFDNAYSLLEENRDILKKLADALLEVEVVQGDTLEKLLKGEEVELETSENGQVEENSETAKTEESVSNSDEKNSVGNQKSGSNR
ncbi:MAG: ATP-dependent zinc metalloprotease FtsH [Candidatus Marinimicrobia bacterium]|nr:ATP-dependent zinc metalloprotease FtsH [Candidatus Neomarinimicrobiota bacterium]MCF7830292.1 ATP-dependent zinc metalloprotease FtsH [Candidatus Neomarinimicrobiota bacterium]MCF7882433.1 ATP-dependent zinc metalloprotease FtsH [Candidatus Neomarinimicrobiota bacterium]